MLANTLKLLKNDKYNNNYNIVGVAVLGRAYSFVREEVTKTGVPIFDFNCMGKHHFFKAIKKLKALIKTEKVNLLHSFMFHSNIITRLAAPKNVKVINAQRNTDVWRKFYHNWLDKLTVNKCDKIICCSNKVMQDTIKRTRISKKKFTVAHNGVNVNDYPPAIHKKKLLYTIGTVASLTRQKGLEYFLKAAQVLLKERKDLVFVIIGEGELRAKLKNLAKLLGIEKFIEFKGQQNAQGWFQTFDVFVLPSRWEGFGNVLIEAGAAGLPVVASNVGGIPEIIKDGENGYLTPVGDAEAIAGRVKILLNNLNIRRRMGVNARWKVNYKFAIQHHVEKVLNVWGEVLYGKGRVRKAFG